MNTQAKLQSARFLLSAVKVSRSLVGKKSDEVICRRSALWWNLDLREGIDLSIYLFHQFDRSTSAAIHAVLFSGATVLDIGANCGAYALPMAKKVGAQGRVYAIEPTDWAFDRLMKNKSLNVELAESLVPLKMFLSDSTAAFPQEIYSSWNLLKSNTHPIHGGDLKSAQNAECMTLDQLVDRLKLTRLDFVKLDVDGFESKVIRGGIKSLVRFKPKLLIEITPYTLEEQGDSLEGILLLLKEAGYRLMSENGKKFISMNASVLRKKLPHRGSINALAVAL